MQEGNGLICAYDLDGDGKGESLSWEDLENERKGTLRWVHLKRTDDAAQDWLYKRKDIPSAIISALLAEDTRPRCTVYDDGVLLNLRGVNLNPGEQLEDLVAIRLWITPDFILSARHYKIMAVSDIRDAIDAGKGPTTIGQFITQLVTGLAERMAPTIDGLEDTISDLEEALLEEPASSIRKHLGNVRRKAILLRRYIGAQRDALTGLIQARPAWLDEDARNHLTEQLDRVTRYVEDLDMLRERAFVLQDEVYSIMSDRMNRIVYMLTVITGVFLPISFLTGLFGINIGGMPGVDSGAAFWIFCAFLSGVIAIELLIFRFLKWI